MQIERCQGGGDEPPPLRLSPQGAVSRGDPAAPQEGERSRGATETEGAGGETDTPGGPQESGGWVSPEVGRSGPAVRSSGRADRSSVPVEWSIKGVSRSGLAVGWSREGVSQSGIAVGWSSEGLSRSKPLLFDVGIATLLPSSGEGFYITAASLYWGPDRKIVLRVFDYEAERLWARNPKCVAHLWASSRRNAGILYSLLHDIHLKEITD